MNLEVISDVQDVPIAMQNTICAVFQDDSEQATWAGGSFKDGEIEMPIPHSQNRLKQRDAGVFFVCLYNSLGTGGLSEFVDYR